jgi:alanine dehydrogenase
MTLLITEEDVRMLVAAEGAMAEAMELMERALVEQAHDRHALVQRLQLDFPPGSAGETEGRSLRLLPAIVPALDAAAVRVYTTNKVGDAGRPAPAELLLLFDHESMSLRAVIEDYTLHTLRTAAPSGVATAHLARRDARRVAVVGTGRHARGQLAAVASARALEDVRVYSRDAGRRVAFCAEMSTLLDCPVVACESAQEAVEGADIVVTATTTSVPVIRSEWLAPGTHVNSIAPAELDEATVLRARLFPCFAEEVAAGTPPWEPIPALLERGALSHDALAIELADVVAGLAPGRTNDEEITVFLSTGMANWDAAIAVWADRAARRLAVGRPLWDGDTGRSLSGLVTPPPTPVS